MQKKIPFQVVKAKKLKYFKLFHKANRIAKNSGFFLSAIQAMKSLKIIAEFKFFEASCSSYETVKNFKLFP